MSDDGWLRLMGRSPPLGAPVKWGLRSDRPKWPDAIPHSFALAGQNMEIRRASSILDFMGGTPLVKLQRILPPRVARVFLKLEGYNPGGSLKARVALRMVLDAEKQGKLVPRSGQTIIEPTGGNTGIGLALAGAIRGYCVILVMPDNYSKEKAKILCAHGARVVFSDSTKGNDSHIRKVEDILNHEAGFVWLDQLSNPSNPEAHYQGTGKEIVQSLEQIDCFVAGIGSGGTIMGAGRRIKEVFPTAKVVGVQPDGCDSLRGKAVPHRIQGLAIGFVSAFLRPELIDEMISVSYEDAIECTRMLAKSEGLLVGISSGANVAAAIRIAQRLGPSKTVVTVAPDAGNSYLDVFPSQP